MNNSKPGSKYTRILRDEKEKWNFFCKQNGEKGAQAKIGCGNHISFPEQVKVTR